LFGGEKKVRVVSNGFLEQPKSTRVSVYAANGNLSLLVEAFDDEGKTRMVMGGLPPLTLAGSDVISAYRTFRMLESLTRFDDAIVKAALIAPLLKVVKDDADTISMRKELARTFGEANLAELMAVIPPNLAATLRHMRDDLGVPFIPDFITDELDLGRIEYSADLEALRIDHPSKRKKRRERQKDLVERLGPHILAYLGPKGVSPEDCSRFEHAAIIAAAKHLTADDSLLVGLGILAGYVMEMASRGGSIPSVSDYFAHSGQSEQLCTAVAHFLAKEFKSTYRPNEIMTTLKGLLLKWDAAKIDETILRL